MTPVSGNVATLMISQDMIYATGSHLMDHNWTTPRQQPGGQSEARSFDPSEAGQYDVNVTAHWWHLIVMPRFWQKCKIFRQVSHELLGHDSGQIGADKDWWSVRGGWAQHWTSGHKWIWQFTIYLLLVIWIGPNIRPLFRLTPRDSAGTCSLARAQNG